MKVQVLRTEKKEAKSGKLYLRVQTSAGWMSCWILGLIPLLETAGQTQSVIDVEVQEEGGFKNIVNLPSETGAELKPSVPAASPPVPPLSPAPDGRAVSIKAQVCGYIASEIIAAMIEGGEKMSTETMRVKYNEIFDIAYTRITTAETSPG